ncbi:hypothetical protein GUY44_06995 [Pimelobacter simplex]|uniref:Uncharacterized protein n=1 Tax=Nocardioides simplex TaxID=2045 RepID=A0A0A1DM86_NOCSI|nr:hypothetical protein [Pimelobacter simplex]AIY17757.1 hypothetical protein KR76_15090 [Pimelobacter simplex]MCG8150218.1 hypothetical protein [Pimelobacter simplex]GEB13572.1 hypothetical protein NSI01_18870 [Pimelobacter simplex]SFM71524.1 hypothetical protein SAMN05421671_3099 [Pimelobacter simplex]
MSEHLVDIPDERATYQMQSWSHADACTCPIARDGHLPGCPYPTTRHYWEPMENGAAKARWKPKRDARAAVMQAARWAGAVVGLGIPAMQVVELPSGRVIWRDSARYPAAGAPVAPPWQAEAYDAARVEQRVEDGEDAAPPSVVLVSTTQAVLF